ncbi:MAG: hypothetical protein ABR579_00175 [Actinomycetota bacterium]
MRRAIAGLTVLIMVLGPGVAGAQPTGGPSVTTYRDLYQSADGAWLVHRHGDTYMYFGGAYRNLDPLRNRTVAWADETKCVVARGKHIKVTVCLSNAKAHKIPNDAFQFDSTLRTAHMHFHRRGVYNWVDWTGHPPPSPDVFPDAGTYGAIGWADLYSDASARGRVLHHEFSKRNHSGFSSLDEGAVVAVFVHNSGNSRLRYQFLSNGTLRYRAVFRTPIS